MTYAAYIYIYGFSCLPRSKTCRPVCLGVGTVAFVARSKDACPYRPPAIISFYILQGKKQLLRWKQINILKIYYNTKFQVPTLRIHMIILSSPQKFAKLYAERYLVIENWEVRNWIYFQWCHIVTKFYWILIRSLSPTHTHTHTHTNTQA
jgi:hypothetical protein